MKKAILLVTSFLILIIIGCANPKQEKPQKIMLLPPDKKVTNVVLLFPDDAETTGEIYSGIYHEISVNKFASALKQSYQMESHPIANIYNKPTFLSLSFNDKTVINVMHLPKDNLLIDANSKQYFYCPLSLNHLVFNEQAKSTSLLPCILYRGVPYVAILSSASINPNDLSPIGTKDKFSYFVKKHSSEPVQFIYHKGPDTQGDKPGELMYGVSAYMKP